MSLKCLLNVFGRRVGPSREIDMVQKYILKTFQRHFFAEKMSFKCLVMLCRTFGQDRLLRRIVPWTIHWKLEFRQEQCFHRNVQGFFLGARQWQRLPATRLARLGEGSGPNKRSGCQS